MSELNTDKLIEWVQTFKMAAVNSQEFTSAIALRDIEKKIVGGEEVTIDEVLNEVINLSSESKNKILMSESTVKKLRKENELLKAELMEMHQVLRKAVDIKFELVTDEAETVKKMEEWVDKEPDIANRAMAKFQTKVTATFCDKEEFEQWVTDRIMNELKSK